MKLCIVPHVSGHGICLSFAQKALSNQAVHAIE